MTLNDIDFKLRLIRQHYKTYKKNISKDVNTLMIEQSRRLKHELNEALKSERMRKGAKALADHYGVYDFLRSIKSQSGNA